MAVSKRTRYEVLRRDNHTCRYCGGTAPDVVLTIDHVTPVALGGSDAPGNLVAACKDCNAGKSSTSPGSVLVENVADDTIRWALARKAAADELTLEREAAEQRRAPFLDAWTSWDKNCDHLPDDWYKAVDRWLESGMPMGSILEALAITIPKRNVSHYDVFRYTSGVIKNMLADLDDRTAAILAEREVVTLERVATPDLIVDFIDRRWSKDVQRVYLHTTDA